MEKVIIDKQFSLKVWDFLKGIYMAVGLPIIALILEQFQIGNFNLNWKELGYLAVANIALYLAKNYFTPTKVIVEKPEAQTLFAAKDRPHPPRNPIFPKK